MTKIQLDLSEDENKVVSIYKATHQLKTKAEAIKQIINARGWKNEIMERK